MEIYEKYLLKKIELDRVKSELESLQGQIYEHNIDAIKAKGLGSITANHGAFKVSVTSGESVKWDEKELNNIAVKIPVKLDVNKTWLKDLKEFNLDLYDEVMACATYTPKKPSFKVERINEEN